MSTKPKFSRAQLDKAMEQAQKQFGHRKNITGFDVGYQWIGGKPTKKLCVRVHVERKIPESDLELSEVFPGTIDGVPLDVIAGTYRHSEASFNLNHQSRQPIIMGGISCGRRGDGTGTLGAVVIDAKTGAPAILSNWHVLVGAHGRIGDPILQPGELDGGVPVRDEIANVERSILDADGDAAIARLNGTRPWLPIQFASFQHATGVRNSVLGEILVKSGRTTGQTRARVDGEGFYRIQYEVRPEVFESRDIKGFKLVPEIHGNPNNVELSSAGDSGSLWINPGSGEAAGLHFAGETNNNPTAEHAIACNVVSVFDRLNIRLATFEDLIQFAKQSAPDSAAVRYSDEVAMELTPHPDWPDFPCVPGWNPRFPPVPPVPRWPGVDPRIINPGPYFPYSGVHGPGRQSGHGTHIPLNSLNSGYRRAERLDILEDIWPRLKQALLEYDAYGFEGVKFSERLRDRIPMGNPFTAIARAVNTSSAFAGWPNVIGRDFYGAVTFGHCCERLLHVKLNSEAAL